MSRAGTLGSMPSVLFDDLGALVTAIGEAGSRLAEIGATEGAAGNISVLAGWDAEPPAAYGLAEPWTTAHAVDELLGALIVVTGAGRRLREIARDPEENLAWLRIVQGHATLHTSRRRKFERPTSEFSSHLALHAAHSLSRGAAHAVVHAQPLHLTYLSHLPAYQEARFLSRRVARWQPECLTNLPNGLGVVPFLLPGSDDLMRATVQAMRDTPLAVWGKHGVVARATGSVMKAVDLIEYVETGARYEYLNLCAGERGEGLTDSEMRAVASAFGVAATAYVEGA